MLASASQIASAGLPDQAQGRSVLIQRIEQMPNMPSPFVMRDWQRVTCGYMDYIFDFEKRGEHLPLMHWQDTNHTMIVLPAYVGNNDGTEGINYLAAVVSGSLVGLDMRAFRGHDWVALGTNFFNPKDGIFLDWPAGKSGGSFWYDVLPNVLFYQLIALYPPDPAKDRIALVVAESWYKVAVTLGGSATPLCLPNIDHTGFDLRAMQAFDNGVRIEPEGAAGIAWIEYMAWQRFKDPRYLAAAGWMIRSLEQKPVKSNPLYEVLLPYAVLAAARMNAEHGGNYDVGKLMNWCFNPLPAPQARPNWGVITGSWSGFEVDGLVGSVSDGGGYAFAMNTFQYVGTLTPLARYDSRYAKPLGKWILNAANAARLFYPNAFDAEHQSSYSWAAPNDQESVIAYEGLRRWKRDSSTAFAESDGPAGRVVKGSYISTKYYHDNPPDEELLVETISNQAPHLEHCWVFNLPEVKKRFLVVAASRLDQGHSGNAFRFSFATTPDGPFAEAFSISESGVTQIKKLPDSLSGKLYVKVESTDRSLGQSACDQLVVDAMAISSCSNISPYAQGDTRVSWIALLDDYSVPIVLYRPESVTDLGLYGSSHVGNLGGIIRPTNVDKILQVDLLRTDYFHAAAYPTFLYYNPYQTEKMVEIEVGDKARDIYNTVTGRFEAQNIRGKARFKMASDSAAVLVIVPSHGKELQRGHELIINGIVVEF